MAGLVPVVRMLNNVPLYGSPMSLVISSHQSVKLPRPGTEEVSTHLLCPRHWHFWC